MIANTINEINEYIYQKELILALLKKKKKKSNTTIKDKKKLQIFYQ